MDVDGALTVLSVIDWLQTISLHSPTDDSGARMRATCAAQRDFDFDLSSGETLCEIPITINFVRGALTRPGGQALERGIGLFNYVNSPGTKPPSAIGCWIGLDNAYYDEVWAQVRNKSFTGCEIELDLAPLRPASEYPRWQIENRRGSLFVLGVSIGFRYTVSPSP